MIKSVSVANVSRVEFVKAQILDLICREGLKPGDRLVSESKIAAQLGVGPVTAHKAFRMLVDAGMIVRYPSRKGTFIKGTTVRTIGVLGFGKEKSFFGDPYFGHVMAGINAVLSERGLPFLFVDASAQGHCAKCFLDLPVGGILAVGSSFWQRRALELKSLARRYPLLVVGALPEDAGLNSVGSDYLNDSRKGVERLIRAGHKNIAVFAGTTIPERLAGFRSAMEARGIPPDERLIFTEPSRELIPDIIKKLLQLRPTAVFFANNSAIAMVLPDIVRAGLRPEILACDDLRDILPRTPLVFSIIRQPMEKMGRVATESLLGLIDGKLTPPVTVALSSEIITAGNAEIRPMPKIEDTTLNERTAANV